MVSWRILAGGYDAFIATYLFTAAANGTADLRVLSRSPTGRDVSWITQHPFNKQLIYAVDELTPTGAVQSFNVNPDGSLSQALDTVSSGGAHPAHVVALPNGKVVVLNYSSGDGRIISTTNGGAKFNVSSPLIKFEAPLGGVSHPHQTVEHEDSLYIPDLGADKIWRVQVGDDDQVTFRQAISQPKGSGPRHIAISGDRLYTLHELTSTLSVQPVPSLDATSTEIASVSIAPTDAPSGAKWSAAEILIPNTTERFPKQYIYTSNRNIGFNPDQRGDTIAIFEHVGKGTSDEKLVLVNQVFTGLSQIRGMEFGPAEGGGDEYLIASGVQPKGGVVVLKKVDGGGNLEVVARNYEVPTRTSFVWL